MRQTDAESRNDFIHKIGVVEKESHYWLDLCHEARLGDPEQRQWLMRESGELLAIFTQSGKTAKAGRR